MQGSEKSDRTVSDMYCFPKVRQHQSWHRSACKRQQQLKSGLLSLPLHSEELFSISRRSNSQRRLSRQAAATAAVACLIGNREIRPSASLQRKMYPHLLLGDAHFISPVHQHHISLLLGKLLHLFGCFAGYPLPLGHLVSIQLVLKETNTKQLQMANTLLLSCLFTLQNCTDVMRFYRYRSDFQVVPDVHSVHIFLRDWVRTVQVSQQTCWLRENKTQ